MLRLAQILKEFTRITFQIHRFLLARDCSEFTNMFTLPSGKYCQNLMTED